MRVPNLNKNAHLGMMTCSHIIECLRNEGIKPESFASSEWDSTFISSNAINYSTASFFQSSSQKREQWWTVDFKRHVSITSYLIGSGTTPSTGWIYNWTLAALNEDDSFKVLHAPLQSSDATRSYNFTKPVITRYARVYGNSLWPSDNSVLAFRYIKFFGSFRSISIRNKCSCKSNRRTSHNVMIIIILIYS